MIATLIYTYLLLFAITNDDPQFENLIPCKNNYCQNYILLYTWYCIICTVIRKISGQNFMRLYYRVAAHCAQEVVIQSSSLEMFMIVGISMLPYNFWRFFSQSLTAHKRTLYKAKMCTKYRKHWKSFYCLRRGICGSFFLWFLFSGSQVVIKKSSNDIIVCTLPPTTQG